MYNFMNILKCNKIGKKEIRSEDDTPVNEVVKIERHKVFNECRFIYIST